MVKLALCIITKGDSELDYLKKAINSAKEYVDEIHITANADHEKTEQWVKENGWDFSYLPWNKDFSQQRNFNFNRASNDVDYIFWMDSDDVLVGGDLLRELAQRAKDTELDCVYLTYWYSCVFTGEDRTEENLERIDIQHQRERLINPRKMRWVGRLHETPLEYEGVKFKHASVRYSETEPIAMLHTGAYSFEPREVTNERNRRNQEILELQLEEERSKGKPDPRTILYLMKIYSYEEDKAELHEKNLILGPEYLKLSGWDEERATCWLMMAKSAGFFGEWEEAHKYIYQAMKEFPNRVETYLRLAEACFYLKKHRDMKHWMEVALSLDEKKATSSIENIHLNKLLAAELTTRYFWDVEKNIRKAAKASEEVFNLNPTETTEDRMSSFQQLANLDIACEHTDKLIQYLVKQGDKKAVLRLLQSLPQAIQLQPFALNLLKKYQKPKIWEKDEICYFANFADKAFEEWSPLSLEKGLGGSETAVVELSKEWVKMGYRVTVYGDPGKDVGMYDGVTYLPYFYFNKKDKFNIFIQWRDSGLAGKISAKKFYVDLHDVWNPASHKPRIKSIDSIFVKSQAHKKLGVGIPEDKMVVISNGIKTYET